MDNNQTLANIHCASVRQIIVIWPVVWAHDPYGDWYIRHTFKAERWSKPPINVADFTRYG